MAVDPTQMGVIYSLSLYGSEGLWKSTDGGANWTQLFPMGSQWASTVPYDFTNNVSMDPTNHLHLLVMSHGACNAPYSVGCEAESNDGGNNWTLTAMPTSWGEGGGVQLLNATSWIWGGAEGNSGTYLTTDHGGTWMPVAPGGTGDANGEFASRPLVPAPDGALYVTTLQGVLRSTDGGMNWTPIKFGRSVGLTVANGNLIAADQWSPTFYKASLSDPMTWSSFPAPPNLAQSQGCSWLDYDAAHHVLYASCLSTAAPFQMISMGVPGSVWRTLLP
jgi:photosystem II stability/assembly factor-like uncharacterized protein